MLGQNKNEKQTITNKTKQKKNKKQTNNKKKTQRNTPGTKTETPNQANMVDSCRSRLLQGGHSEWAMLLLYENSKRCHTHIQLDSFCASVNITHQEREATLPAFLAARDSRGRHRSPHLPHLQQSISSQSSKQHWSEDRSRAQQLGMDILSAHIPLSVAQGCCSVTAGGLLGSQSLRAPASPLETSPLHTE